MGNCGGRDKMSNISKSVKRVDASEKIRGEAKYLNDIDFGDILYAKTLRSTKARAKILSIALPEISKGYYIVDKKDIPKNRVKMMIYDQPFFAEEVVNYIGEPILLVVGPDRVVIEDILNNIKVIYEDMEAIFTIEQAEEGKISPIFKDDNCFAKYHYEKGKVESIKEKAAYVFDGEYETGYQEHIYLETQGAVAAYENGKVTIWGSIQCPYYVKDAVVEAFDLEKDKVQIIQTTTGGAFGGKEEYPSLLGGQIAAAAIKTGKKVKLIFDRDEDIQCTTKRHPSKIYIKTYLDEDYKILGMECEVKLDGGAYAGISNIVLQRAIFAVVGVYNVDNIIVNGKVLATNNIVTGAFRGFGAPQSFYAVESHMDQIAERLGICPVELKKRNLIKQGDYSSTGGLFREHIPLLEIIDKIEEMSAYSKKYKNYNNSNSFKGIGLSVFFHGGGFTGTGEKDVIKTKVKMKKHKDNKVEILISNVEMGQGVRTTMKKIVSETLNIPLEEIIYDNPDTDLVPNSGPTVASRTILIVGKLIEEASKEIKSRWNESEEFEVYKEYEHPEGFFFDGVKLKGDAYNTYSFGANVVEVEVNPVTYEVEVKGVWTVFDVGNAIDEKIIEGQIEGGVVQGLGYGSIEVMNSREGKLLQKTNTDYVIPTSMEYPKINIALVNSPYAGGPFGAKSAGELTLVGAGTAYALAVQNALKRPISKLPVTPEYVMEVMDKYEYGKF